VAPAAAEKVPPGHWLHALCPLCNWNEPALHVAHVESAALPLKRPGAQAVHELCEGPEKRPGSHATHAEALAAGKNRPASQSMHDWRPTAS
jgi:hypothetical protein